MTRDGSTTGNERSIARPFARRAAGYRASPWAIVYTLLARHPDPISFANGAPAAEMVPWDRLRGAAAVAWAATDGLGYGEVAGYLPLRRLIAARLAAQGIEASPDNILLTTGSQQGIDLIARLMLDPGDLVAIEGPSYLGALQAFDACEADYLVVPTDAEGLSVAALERLLNTAPRRPKLLYTIPTFQNPTGSTAPLVRRQALLALCRQHGILVVEDDPYGELRFEGEAVPPLRALDLDVLYLGTFSKTIAPGLRLGWIVAPDDLVVPLATAREAADIHGELMTQRLVAEAAAEFLDDHVNLARQVYRARRDALLEGLAAAMPPGVRWDRPAGGFFVWLELPAGVEANTLLARAAAEGVAFLPGAWCWPGQRGDATTLRLSYSSVPPARAADGAWRLGQAVRAALGE